MSIKPHPGKPPLTAPSGPSWGDFVPEGETAEVVRFILAGRTVSFPFTQLKYWELVAGEPEFLTLHAEKQAIAIEGRNLNAIAAALDLRRVSEVRSNREFQSERTAPQVREITIGPA